MKSRVLLAFLLLVLAGILGPDTLPRPHTPPTLSWSVIDPRTGVEDPAVTAGGRARVPDGELRVIARARALQGIDRLEISGVGGFRCRSRSGELAPYDVVLPLPTVRAELYEFDGGRQTSAAAALPALRFHGLSCGRHRLPRRAQAEELFVDSGSALLRVTLEDRHGELSTEQLVLTLDPRNPPALETSP